MKYKVFFYFGDELSIKTTVVRGYAWLDDSGLHIEGPGGIDIPSSDLQNVELFRLHGLGRIIQIEYRRGRLFLAVVRFMIGQFAITNFFKTGTLQKQLAALANRGH